MDASRGRGKTKAELQQIIEKHLRVQHKEIKREGRHRRAYSYTKYCPICGVKVKGRDSPLIHETDCYWK